MRDACEGLTDDLLALGVELPSVYLLVGRRLRCQAARGYFQVVDGFPTDVGVIGRAVTSGQPVVVEDASADPEFIAARPDLRGEVCVPVLADGLVLGAVNAESTGSLPADWLGIVEAAGHALGQRIKDLGGLPAESLNQRLLHAVLEITLRTAPEAIAEHAVRAAVDLSGMDSACLIDIPQDDPDGGLTGDKQVLAAVGPLAAAFAELTGPQLATMASWVSGGTSSHFPGGPGAPPTYAFLADAGIGALGLHPMLAGGHLVGLLVVAHRCRLPHDPQLVEALELLAAQTATSIMTARSLADLRRRADRDPLTGLRNLSSFDADLAARLSSTPPERACACLLVDVDGFKEVNDQRGHLAGDEVLRRLAVALTGALRDGDELYRVGGDEFAALLYVRSEADAMHVADRLLDAASGAGAPVSIGVALSAAEPATVLRERADQALYGAKRAGRNTAQLAGVPRDRGNASR